MAGESPLEAESSAADGFLSQAPWKKMVISVAGVAQNAVFAVVLMWIVFLYGTDTLKPVINEVIKGHPAEKAGLMRGDEIKAIDGKKVLYWNQISDILAEKKGAAVKVTISRAGKEMEIAVTPDMEETEDLIKDKKIRPDMGILPVVAVPVIDDVIKDTPAEAAGLKANDVISSINGKKIEFWDDITTAVKSSGGKELSIGITRAGAAKEIIFRIIPRKEAVEDKEKKKVETYIIGIHPKNNIVKERYGPGEAFVKGCGQVWYFAEITVKSVYKMIARKIEPDIAGPIGVAQIAYKVAKIGLIPLLSLVAVINVSLVLFNLLPMVPFDGGLLLLFFIEMITGKPVPLKVQEKMMEIGWGLVILLLVFVTYNDILRWVKGS